MSAPTPLDILTTTPQPLPELAQQLQQGLEATKQQLAALQDFAPLLVTSDGYALTPGTPAPKLVGVAGRLGRHFRYLAHTGSTQQEVQRLGRWLEERGESPHGALVVAEEQSQGRGRRGRSWLGGRGNLLFSLLLCESHAPQGPAPLRREHLPLLPLACGVALQAACGGRLKWPNDLLSPDRRKLGGILLEAEWHGQELRQVVLGVGINVSSAPPQAATLQELAPYTDGPYPAPLSRAAVLERILAELEYWLGQDAPQVLAAWRRVNLTLGREVTVTIPQGQVRGIAEDLGPAGELLVRRAKGLVTVTAGDVELVGQLAPQPQTSSNVASSLQFRRAVPDDAPQAAPLILEANGSLAHHLTGTPNDVQALEALEALFRQTGQRLSHQNTWLALRGGACVGLAVVYPGEQAEGLDAPLRQRLHARGLDSQIVSEGVAGELYLDTLATHPSERGQGTGTQLLRHLQGQAAAQGRPLGLLVEQGNPARRLYERVGFVPLEDVELAGHRYTRLRWTRQDEAVTGPTGRANLG